MTHERGGPGPTLAARASANTDGVARVLVVSNGHGEDTIGARLVRELRAHAIAAPLALVAWPMVGEGSAYVKANVEIRGPHNRLPSEGFGTLSARAFARDVRAGWLGVHWSQWKAAKTLRKHFHFVVAIGDVVPLVVARRSKTPFVFVGCAKSAYYDGKTGYTALERQLMRSSVAVYPRDARTADALSGHDIPVRAVGNPMMDTLLSLGTPPMISWMTNERVIACLPGSRADCEQNAARVLTMLAEQHAQLKAARLTHVAFAVADSFDVEKLRALLTRSPAEWRWANTMSDRKAQLSLHAGALRATVAFGAMHEILQHADVAIGLAGTANEQAIGCGVPVVTFATDGAQGDDYLRMKMPYFGASVLRVAGESRAVCGALLRIVGDDSLRSSMIAAGRERMGTPGATAAIARDIIDFVARR